MTRQITEAGRLLMEAAIQVRNAQEQAQDEHADPSIIVALGRALVDIYRVDRDLDQIARTIAARAAGGAAWGAP